MSGQRRLRGCLRVCVCAHVCGGGLGVCEPMSMCWVCLFVSAQQNTPPVTRKCPLVASPSLSLPARTGAGLAWSPFAGPWLTQSKVALCLAVLCSHRGRLPYPAQGSTVCACVCTGRSFSFYQVRLGGH